MGTLTSPLNFTVSLKLLKNSLYYYFFSSVRQRCVEWMVEGWGSLI